MISRKLKKGLTAALVKAESLNNDLNGLIVDHYKGKLPTDGQYKDLVHEYLCYMSDGSELIADVKVCIS